MSMQSEPSEPEQTQPGQVESGQVEPGQAEPDQRSWFSRRLLPGGTEPDPRFTLANERTFLAWMRTALAMLAGAIALEAFPIADVEPWLRRTAAVLMAVLGVVVAASAMVRWVRVERAMRWGRPLPVAGVLPVLGWGTVVAGLTLLIMVLAVG